MSFINNNDKFMELLIEKLQNNPSKELLTAIATASAAIVNKGYCDREFTPLFDLAKENKLTCEWDGKLHTHSVCQNKVEQYNEEG